MNNKGIITVKTLVLIIAVVMIFTVLISSLHLGFNQNQLLRNKSLIASNALANYQTELFINYGLYGVKDHQVRGYIHHNLYRLDPVDIEYSQPLTDTFVLKKQINSFMLLRMPVNYMDQLLSKLDVIKKSKASSDVLDKKKYVDVALSELGHEFDQRAVLSLEVNSLTRSGIESYITTFEACLDRLKELQADYELLDDKSAIKDEIQENLTIYHAIKETLEMYENANLELIECIIFIAKQSIDLEHLITQTKEMITSDTDALEVVKETLLESLEKERQLLYQEKDETTIFSGEFNVYMSEISVDEKWYALLSIPFENYELLKSITEEMPNYDSNDITSGAFTPFSLGDLIRYEQVISVDPVQVDPDSKSYYNTQKVVTETEQSINPPGRTAETTFYHTSSKGSFWEVLKVNITSIYESLTVNEYIMSTFTSFAEPSITDYDFFDKYNRQSYYSRGEIEYILMGHNSETVNIAETYTVVLGVRTIMNGLHVYTDKEKLSLSESIGVGVAGWTGLGAPLVSNIIRLAWSTGESIYDLNELTKGESIAFYKIYPNQWHLDLGLVYKKESIPKYMDLMSFTYHDYLRFMLITVPDEIKLKRIVNLIELNLSLQNESLHLMYTRINIDGYSRSYHEE